MNNNPKTPKTLGMRFSTPISGINKRAPRIDPLLVDLDNERREVARDRAAAAAAAAVEEANNSSTSRRSLSITKERRRKKSKVISPSIILDSPSSGGERERSTPKPPVLPTIRETQESLDMFASGNEKAKEGKAAEERKDKVPEERNDDNINEGEGKKDDKNEQEKDDEEEEEERKRKREKEDKYNVTLSEQNDDEDESENELDMTLAMLANYGKSRRKEEEVQGEEKRREKIEKDRQLTLMSERLILLHQKYGWRSPKAWEGIIREGKMPGGKELRSARTWYGLLLPGSLTLEERNDLMARRGKDFLPIIKDYGAVDKDEVFNQFREREGREPAGTAELNKFMDDVHFDDRVCEFKPAHNCYLPSEIYSQYSWLADDEEVEGQIVLTKGQMERELSTTSLPRDLISFSVSHLSTLFPKQSRRGLCKGMSIFDSHGNEFIASTAPFSEATRASNQNKRMPTRLINICVICKGLMLSKYHATVLCTCIPAGITFSKEAMQLAEGKSFSACWIHFQVSGKEMGKRE